MEVVRCGGSRRLRYRGFWWRVIEGGHRIGLRWEGNVEEEHWGPGMWQWNKLLLGGSLVIDFHLGDGMES